MARVFEMRTYYAHPGKYEAMNARFRNHTLQLFEKHGMTNVAYWNVTSGDNAGSTLVYVLAFPSAEAKTAAWDAFRADLEWQRVRAESEVNGPLVAKLESVMLTSTDYSPLK